MEDKLIEILSQYDYPVILQGSLAQGEEYPEHFLHTGRIRETTPAFTITKRIANFTTMMSTFTVRTLHWYIKCR